MIARADLQRRAAVLSYFEAAWLLGAKPADTRDEPTIDESAIAKLTAFLLEECARVTAPDGVRYWTLGDRTRRTIAERSTQATLRAAWTAVRTTRPHDPTQWAIDALVGDAEAPVGDVGRLSRPQALALEAASRWFGGVLPDAPDPNALRRQAQREELTARLAAVADACFVGRRGELMQLERQRALRRPVLVVGFGGIGKDALLARHLLDAQRKDDTLIASLSFDDSALDPLWPASIVRPLLRQLLPQLDPPDARLGATLAAQLDDFRRSGHGAVEATTRGLAPRTSSSAALFGGYVAPLLGGRRLLLTLDTVEQVQRGGPVACDALAEVVEGARPHCDVVLAGRAPLPGLPVDHVTLTGLDPTAAIELLERLVEPPAWRGLAPAVVVEQVGTSPLCLRLAARLIASTSGDVALSGIELRDGRIEGELYRRVLGHVEDPAVRRLAHPGLTVRRVTPAAVIRHVLAKPCGIRVDDDARAHELFERLAREAMLVERLPGRHELVHRADVRQLMLAPLAADDPEKVRSIHRAAIRHYEAEGDFAARTEATYHRLMLDQRPRTLDRHWDDGMLGSLERSYDELPADARAYLAGKSPSLDVSDAELRQAPHESARRIVVRRVSALAGDNRLDAAVATLEDHVSRTGDDTPEIADLRIQLLELTGRLVEALHVAEREQARAERRGDRDRYFTATLHRARIAERLGEVAAADAALVAALELSRRLTVRPALQLTQLQLLVARLGLQRRSGCQLAWPSGEPVDLVEELFDAVGTRAVGGVPGLLRDLAGELGRESPRVLKAALRKVGVDPARPIVQEALRASSLGEPTIFLSRRDEGSSGEMVFDLLDSAEPSAETEALGEAVTEAFTQAGDEAIAFERDPEEN